MIHQVNTLPPGALPIADGPIPLAISPGAYVAMAARCGYLVVQHQLRAYLVRQH